MRHLGPRGSLAVGAGLALAYFLAGRLGLSLALVHPSASSVWPPTGIAISALLLLGYRYAPAIFAGAFLVNLTMGSSVLASLGIATGNALEGVAGALLLRRFAAGRRTFERARHFFAFLLFGAMASSTVSATFGVVSLSLAGAAEWSLFGSVWTTWWLGDVVGAIVFVPLVVLWANQPRLGWRPAQTREALLLLLGIVLVGWVSFGPFPWGAKHYPITFLPVPVLLWAAFRFGPRETAMASLVVGSIATWGTWTGYGPFARMAPAESLLMLEVFQGFVAAMALLIAIVVQEGRRAAAALQRSREELESTVERRTATLAEANQVLAAEIVDRMQVQRALELSETRFRDLLESAPDAVLLVDQQGWIKIVNSQAERFFGYRREELLGQPVELLIPERYRDKHRAHRTGFVASPHMRAMGEGMELYGRRKDGSEFPVEIGLSPLQQQEEQLISATIRDVSKSKRAEQERRANESLRSQVEQLSRRTREIGILNRMNDVLRAAASPAEAYPLLPPFLEELFPHNSGALYAFDESRAFLEAVAPWGKAPPVADVFVPDDCWALRRGQSHWVEGAGRGPTCKHLPPPSPAASLCIPMTAQGETIGLFCLQRLAAPDPAAAESPPLAEYKEYKQKLARAVAEQIAGALANARLQDKLRSQAIRDPLTGLLNRRSFEESFDRELHRAVRRQSSLGLLMLDIDHFKQLNDRAGHAAGDHALREIARFLQQFARKEDLACRYGGEELVLVFADCGLKDAWRRTEQVRQGVKDLYLEHEGHAVGPVTLSAGIAVFPIHGRTATELLRAADEALYDAKRAGRDRCMVAGSMRLLFDAGEQPDETGCRAAIEEPRAHRLEAGDP